MDQSLKHLPVVIGVMVSRAKHQLPSRRNIPIESTILGNFWAYAKRTASGCLEWTRAARKGYGYVHYKGCHIGAHVAAWILANGRKVPNGLNVLHTCDNPLCIEPMHLFVGTHQDNSDDKQAKGRAKYLGRPRKIDKHTEKQICKQYGSGTISLLTLGGQYGVSQGTIYNIIKQRYVEKSL